jgi:hypothetical protein
MLFLKFKVLPQPQNFLLPFAGVGLSHESKKWEFGDPDGYREELQNVDPYDPMADYHKRMEEEMVQLEEAEYELGKFMYQAALECKLLLNE